METLDALLKERPPNLLFHYTDGNGLLGILEKQKIWASSVYHLNDAKEFRYAVDLITERLAHRIQHSNNGKRESCRGILDQMPELTKGVQVYVASFSAEGDLLSQWLAYSGSGNGYAIGFSESHFALAETEEFRLVRCVYDKDQQVTLADAVIDVLTEDNPSQSEKELSKALIVAAAIKHPGFEREAEWRLVRTSAAGFGLSKPAKFRQGRNGIVPYWEAPLTLEEKTKVLVPSVICVGPNDDMDAATLAVMTLLDSKGLLPFIGKRKVELLTSKTPYRP